MKLRSIGTTHQPSVAILGVFDPILPAHLDLFAEVRDYARLQGFQALVMLIDPNPGSLMFGRVDWPVFHDRDTRIRLIQESGIDGVLLLRFFRQDLFAIAADFFEAIDPVTNVVELWLGARQSIGSGPESSPTIVQQMALARGITIKRLPAVELTKMSREVRRSLWTGTVRDAFAVSGQFPQRLRPRTGTLRLAWQPGRYLAVASSSAGEPVDGQTLELDLVEDGRRISRMQWPDERIDRLAFVAGPADAFGDHLATERPVGDGRGTHVDAAMSSRKGGVVSRD